MVQINNISLLLLLLGVFYIYYTSKFANDPEYAANRLKTSPKAWLWKQILGEAKRDAFYRKFYVPMGYLWGVGLVIYGLMTII